MHQILGSGTIRRWDFLEGWPQPRLTYREVSVLDLLEYAQRNGRPIDALDAMKVFEFDSEIERFYAEKEKPNIRQ